ncbi:unnamed protein product [Timema podura]|uniref:Uncharacterized protein n=1 Tax=Timema podura TaxID=61482 RepID=A0ABN7NQV3_TIMPD|nr:unnamed protein product [Timema podura]
MNFLLIFTIILISAMGAMLAVPLPSQHVAVTPTEKKAIEEVNDVIHHLEKRQMPDMGMMKDLAPKMSQQMSAMVEAGVQPEEVSNGAKKFMKMGTSAMDMFKNMQGCAVMYLLYFGTTRLRCYVPELFCTRALRGHNLMVVSG